MSNITPNDNNVILKIIENENKIGSIIIPDNAVEESTLAEVVIENQLSYDRLGNTRAVFLEKGMRVRLPKGKCGTFVPEAPEGETWVCVPEDVIYYIIEE